MQTVSIQIQDSYFQSFMNYVQDNSSNITITKDKNLEYDLYFYERKKDLEEIIKDSENGSIEMLSQKQYDAEMEIFFKELKINANF